jgi:hypothetical protein
MFVPSVKRLTSAFRDLDSKGARLIRALAHAVDDPEALAALVEAKCPMTHAYVRSMYSDPYNSRTWRRTVALHAIDLALGTHGVEALGPVDMRSGPPYEYCNAGDTYSTTIVYDRDRDRLIVASWGDIAERDPRLTAGGES